MKQDQEKPTIRFRVTKDPIPKIVLDGIESELPLEVAKGEDRQVGNLVAAVVPIATINAMIKGAYANLQKDAEEIEGLLRNRGKIVVPEKPKKEKHD